jgi:hypothetical protein
MEQNLDKWTVSTEEINFIKNKEIKNQLAIAIKLKFFEQYGYKLQDIAEIKDEIINYLAILLEVNSDSIASYNWDDRTSRSHDDYIRKYLGFRGMDDNDLSIL